MTASSVLAATQKQNLKPAPHLNLFTYNYIMLRVENQYQKTSFNTDLTQELLYQLKQLKLERIIIQR